MAEPDILIRANAITLGLSASRKLSGLHGGISLVKSASVEVFKALRPLGRKTRFPLKCFLYVVLSFELC